MASCQSHSAFILSHLMHPNLAQISRVWVAASILRSTIDRDPFQLQPPALLQQTAHPSSLINWTTNHSPHCYTDTQKNNLSAKWETKLMMHTATHSPKPIPRTTAGNSSKWQCKHKKTLYISPLTTTNIWSWAVPRLWPDHLPCQPNGIKDPALLRHHRLHQKKSKMVWRHVHQCKLGST